jgi:hypothetical protein
LGTPPKQEGRQSIELKGETNEKNRIKERNERKKREWRKIL